MARRFVVEGKVQGVWFRESTRREAQKLGLTGYAINLPNGSVEVLACGSPEMIERLEAWLQVGPPMATVLNVASLEISVEAPDGFTTS